MKLEAQCFFVVALITASCLDSGRNEPDLQAFARDLPVTGLSVDGYQAVYSSADWRQSLRGMFDAKGVTVHNFERDPATGLIHHWKESFSTSFSVVSVAPAFANHFYVLGRAAGGVPVIERWTAQVVDGAYDSHRDVGGPTVAYVAGNTYIPPTGAPRISMDREELFRDLTHGPIVRISADPDDRYVLGIARLPGGAQVIRLDTESLDVSVIATSSSTPELASMDAFELIHHGAEGMMHVAFCANILPKSTDKVIFFDHDLDGEIDSVIPFTAQAFEAAGFYNKADWQEDLIVH